MVGCSSLSLCLTAHTHTPASDGCSEKIRYDGSVFEMPIASRVSQLFNCASSADSSH
jgi:hypothetical protein